MHNVKKLLEFKEMNPQLPHTADVIKSEHF